MVGYASFVLFFDYTVFFRYNVKTKNYKEEFAMKLTNIHPIAIISAAGKIVEPGKSVRITVEYYAEKKDFLDQYVIDKKAEIHGMEEYYAYIEKGKGQRTLEDEVVVNKDTEIETKAEPTPKSTASAKATTIAKAAATKAKAEAEAKVKAKAEAEAKAKAKATKTKSEAEARAKAAAAATRAKNAEKEQKQSTPIKAKATTIKSK